MCGLGVRFKGFTVRVWRVLRVWRVWSVWRVLGLAKGRLEEAIDVCCLQEWP